MNAKTKRLEDTLTSIAGVPVEVTMNLSGGATFSFDGENNEAVLKIKNFFGNLKVLEVEFDEECDFTCIYMSLQD